MLPLISSKRRFSDTFGVLENRREKIPLNYALNKDKISHQLSDFLKIRDIKIFKDDIDLLFVELCQQGIPRKCQDLCAGAIRIISKIKSIRSKEITKDPLFSAIFAGVNECGYLIPTQPLVYLWEINYIRMINDERKAISPVVFKTNKRLSNSVFQSCIEFSEEIDDAGPKRSIDITILDTVDFNCDFYVVNPTKFIDMHIEMEASESQENLLALSGSIMQDINKQLCSVDTSLVKVSCTYKGTYMDDMSCDEGEAVIQNVFPINWLSELSTNRSREQSTSIIASNSYETNLSEKQDADATTQCHLITAIELVGPFQSLYRHDHSIASTSGQINGITIDKLLDFNSPYEYIPLKEMKECLPRDFQLLQQLLTSIAYTPLSRAAIYYAVPRFLGVHFHITNEVECRVDNALTLRAKVELACTGIDWELPSARREKAIEEALQETIALEEPVAIIDTAETEAKMHRVDHSHGEVVIAPIIDCPPPAPEMTIIEQAKQQQDYEHSPPPLEAAVHTRSISNTIAPATTSTDTIFPHQLPLPSLSIEPRKRFRQESAHAYDPTILHATDNHRKVGPAARTRLPTVDFHTQDMPTMMGAYLLLHGHKSKLPAPSLSISKTFSLPTSNNPPYNTAHGSTPALTTVHTQTHTHSEVAPVVAHPQAMPPMKSIFQKTNLRVLVAERLLESMPRLIGDLKATAGISCVDCKLQAPIAIIVDSVTCICLVLEGDFKEDKHFAKQFLKHLSEIVFKFHTIWVVVARTEAEKEDDIMDAFNEITLGFCQQLSHFPAKVILRHTSSRPLAMMMLVTRICEQAFLASVAQHCTLEKYVFRPFLDLIPLHAVFSVRLYLVALCLTKTMSHI